METFICEQIRLKNKEAAHKPIVFAKQFFGMDENMRAELLVNDRYAMTSTVKTFQVTDFDRQQAIVIETRNTIYVVPFHWTGRADG